MFVSKSHLTLAFLPPRRSSLPPSSEVQPSSLLGGPAFLPPRASLALVLFLSRPLTLTLTPTLTLTLIKYSINSLVLSVSLSLSLSHTHNYMLAEAA